MTCSRPCGASSTMLCYWSTVEPQLSRPGAFYLWTSCLLAYDIYVWWEREAKTRSLGFSIMPEMKLCPGCLFLAFDCEERGTSNKKGIAQLRSENGTRNAFQGSHNATVTLRRSQGGNAQRE